MKSMSTRYTYIIMQEMPHAQRMMKEDIAWGLLIYRDLNHSLLSLFMRGLISFDI